MQQRRRQRQAHAEQHVVEERQHAPRRPGGDRMRLLRHQLEVQRVEAATEESREGAEREQPAVGERRATGLEDEAEGVRDGELETNGEQPLALID